MSDHSPHANEADGMSLYVSTADYWRARAERAEAECERLRADAERYRRLRDKLGQTQLPTLIERITSGYVADYKPSIDAAMQAGKENT